MCFCACCRVRAGLQKGNHYQVEDGYDAMNSIFACGLLEDIHIEPEQDPTDVNKINVKIRVEEVQPKTLEVRNGRRGAGNGGLVMDG